MPRPPRCRKICSYPDFWAFAPEGEEPKDTLTLSLDEFETLRQIDYEGLTQEACAARMGVARTTVTAIYDAARRKLTTALVKGARVVISGGNYELLGQSDAANLAAKGENTMRIATTHKNGEIFAHFGHSEEFKIYDVENGAIMRSEVVGTNGQGHGALAGFLREANVDKLICGGIGGGAVAALKEAGVEIYAGANGSANEAVDALLAGKLEQLDTANCDHHGHGHSCGHHHHEGEGHSCGAHEHGEHTDGAKMRWRNGN